MKLRDIRRGETFIEVVCGASLTFVALEDARSEDGGYKLRAKQIGGAKVARDQNDVVLFYDTHGADRGGPYALRLHRSDADTTGISEPRLGALRPLGGPAAVVVFVWFLIAVTVCCSWVDSAVDKMQRDEAQKAETAVRTAREPAR